MKFIEHRNHRQHNPKLNQTIFALLIAFFSVTTASAQGLSTYESRNGILKKLSGNGPDIIVIDKDILQEISLWEKTRHISIAGFDAAKSIYENSLNSTLEFLDRGENSTWASIAVGGAGVAAGGASAITTTSVLGLISITSAPAIAIIAVSAGSALAISGASHLIWENIDVAF